MPREQDGFVYLMKDNRNRVKIGVATDVKKRFDNLKISNPDLEIYGKIPTKKYKSLETFIHKTLKEKNVGGEWFSPEDEIILSVFQIILNHGHKFEAYYIIT